MVGSIEKKISDYIDDLNAGKKPDSHESADESPEFEELAGIVRIVRCLKEPEMPGADYPKKLVAAVTPGQTHTTVSKKKKKAWFAWTAAAAAVLVLALLLNFVLPFTGSTNIVYAMEQAFSGVKAYRGVLEIVSINEEGEEILQSRREVWADRDGRYYVRELEGIRRNLVTVNNGQKKWQVLSEEKTVTIFPAFPDPYRFTFELGDEIRQVGNALKTKVVGEERIAGRTAIVIEVTPGGGLPYRLWVDRDTSLPLKKQCAMYNALQYRASYTEIEFFDAIPDELLAYSLPEGYTETDRYPGQMVNNIQEVVDMAGFEPRLPAGVPDGYRLDGMSVMDGDKTVKFSYVSLDGKNTVIILQAVARDGFRPASMATLGRIGEKTAEVQSPVSDAAGVLADAGPYEGAAGISSIRWQASGMEYAVIGNASLGDLILFADSVSDGLVQIPAEIPEHETINPQVDVEVDMAVEENEQKSVDNGHTPWKLDPVFTAHVFVNLHISPGGIHGEYAVDYTELAVISNNGVEAIVEVGGDVTQIRKVYLKKLVRQDGTGIWTVVGYDPVSP